jgi:hypothetical protein
MPSVKVTMGAEHSIRPLILHDLLKEILPFIPVSSNYLPTFFGQNGPLRNFYSLVIVQMKARR